ncbi:hypothetical protein [Streptomyces violascens]
MSFRTSPATRVTSRFSGRLARLSWVDAVVAAAVLVLFYVVLQVGHGTTVRFSTDQSIKVDTDPGQLPYDAARSLLR